VKLAALMCSLAAMTGCASLPTPAPVEFATPKPVARTTPYTKPLTCLGELYSTYSSNQSPLLIGVMPASDVTGASQFTSAEVPREFTLMVEAAVNSVSPRIRLINVDHEFQVRENAVGGKFTRVTPRLLLKPGISEFDRGINISSSKKDLSGFFGKGKGATDFSLDRGNEAATARIGVDMMAYEYGTMSSIPNVHASVGAEVGRQGATGGWSVSIYGWGVGNTASQKGIQARHEAVRILTEYAVLQTLGRYLKLPYWRCVEGMAEDPAIRLSLSGYHQKLQPKEQLSSLQELLQYHGFGVQKNGVMDESTQGALSAVVQANAEAAKDASASDLYYKLYVSIPVGNVPQHPGWHLIAPLPRQQSAPAAALDQLSSAAPAATPAPQAAATPAPQKAVPQPASAAPAQKAAAPQRVKLALGSDQVKPGQKLELMVASPTGAHLYCFVQEASGAVQMIYPNRFARNTQIAANSALRLPGNMPFELLAPARGERETIACVAAERDVTAKLPQKGRDFERLPFKTIEDAALAIGKLSGENVELARLEVQPK
jgi:hypothetical protein